MKRLVLILLIVVTSGCSIFQKKEINPFVLWKETQKGEIKGKLNLRWVGPDKFVFMPDKDDPFVFIRKKNGVEVERIMPNLPFYTDGGSIPRAAHASKDFSPWNFGPAFIIHDWLFEMNHCALAGHEKYNHEIAAEIMAEVIKTQLLTDSNSDSWLKTANNAVVLYDFYSLVVSFSKGLWLPIEGRCDLVK